MQDLKNDAFLFKSDVFNIEPMVSFNCFNMPFVIDEAIHQSNHVLVLLVLFELAAVCNHLLLCFPGRKLNFTKWESQCVAATLEHV